MPKNSEKKTGANKRALCLFSCLAIACAECFSAYSCTRTADEPEGKIRFTLSRDELELFEGEEYVLCVIKTPADGRKTPVSWRTDNPNVAGVNGGKVRAEEEGETFISAQTREYTLSCKVTVKKRDADISAENNEDKNAANKP